MSYGCNPVFVAALLRWSRKKKAEQVRWLLAPLVHMLKCLGAMLTLETPPDEQDGTLHLPSVYECV